MSWRLKRRLIWLAAFGWMAAAAGDLAIDGPALASPTQTRTWTQPDCAPSVFSGCSRYDDAVPR